MAARWPLLALLLAVILSAVAPPASAAQAPRNMIFVLDASGSMWGRVQGEPKITVATQAMGNVLQSLPEQTRAALVSYGHRRKGDCEDIETLQPMTPLDREAMAAQLDSLKPKGKTPLAAAVGHAVEIGRALEDATTIVLLSDGLESCGGDPCAAVREAREMGIDFRMHVVGFDLAEADTSSLRCMAEEGGGRYFDAGSPEELNAALEEAVAQPSMLAVRVTSNGEPAKATVTALQDGARAGKADTDAEGWARLDLEPGAYDLRVEPAIRGVAAKELNDIVLPEGETVEKHVAFDAARLRVTVLHNEDPASARIRVYDQNGEQVIWRDAEAKNGGAVTFTLAPGAYDLTVDPDNISAPEQKVEDVTVEAGALVEEYVYFGSGELRVSITHNGKPGSARVRVYDQNGEQMTWQDARAKDGGAVTFTLPPATYDLTVDPHGITASPQEVADVEVRQTAVTERKVAFGSGELLVSVSHNGQPGTARVRVYDQYGDQVARMDAKAKDGGTVTFTLPPGTYKATADPRHIAAPVHEIGEVSVKAGARAEATAKFSSGELAVRVTQGGQPASTRVRVYDQYGDQVARRDAKAKDGGTVTFTLPPGTYSATARMRTDQGETERKVEGIAVDAGATVEETLAF